jgi:hypothetical protein
VGVITYTAVNRGFLVGGHSASTQYQIETSFNGYPLTFIAKGDKDEALDGTPEGWLHALQREYQVVSDLVLLAARPNWREFFTSVMNAETFQIDFTGTIAAPGTDINLWLPDAQVPEPQIFGIGVQYTFRAKVVP